jgi:hypothetical protein
MNIGRPRTSPRGLRQITEGLGALDAEVFEAVANARSPLLDPTMPALTRAADHAKLCLPSRRPWQRRATGRHGAAPAAVSSASRRQA